MKKIFTRKNIIIVIILIVLILVGIISIPVINKITETEEEKLTRSLKDLGKEFYEDLYYAQQSQNENERTENLERFKDLGIKVTLDTLTRFRTSEENEEALKMFVNPNTSEECDKYASMVTIYPKSPYKKSDYRIDAYLVCGFEEEQEEETPEEKYYPPKEDENSEGIVENSEE